MELREFGPSFFFPCSCLCSHSSLVSRPASLRTQKTHTQFQECAVLPPGGQVRTRTLGSHQSLQSPPLLPHWGFPTTDLTTLLHRAAQFPPESRNFVE